MHVRRVLALASLLTAVPVFAIADDAMPLATGARVRITSPLAERLTGRLLTLDDDRLTIESDRRRETVTIRRGEISALDVGRGRHSRWRKAAIGATLAAGAGAAYALTRFRRDSWVSPGEIALATATLTAPIGALIGFALRPGERWSPMPLDGVRGVAAGSAAGRASVSLTFTF